jgi:hypothetical protein
LNWELASQKYDAIVKWCFTTKWRYTRNSPVPLFRGWQNEVLTGVTCMFKADWVFFILFKK